MTDVREAEQAICAAFKEAYASLNAAQKQAVDTIDGSVMVIAGPGTGKTQILTLRIANILLQTDTAPESILALTFTDSGAKAMRNRLRRYIGSRAYRVPIYTFHSFCGGLISDYPDAYNTIIGATIATELEKIDYIETILNHEDIKLLRPLGNPSYYVPHIVRMLSSLKQENITPDRLATIIVEQEQELETIERVYEKGAHKGKVRGEYTKKETAIAKNRELLTVYRSYLALMNSNQRYDFDDMIMETITALTANEAMLLDLQERYQYVLADEHQDVNGAQNTLLELLTSYHDSPNIFVVGDEKQAIYRFQGASLENFLYFEDVYHDTTTISLTENYRSGQAILDTAHSLVAVEDGPLKDLRVSLTAAAVESSSVTCAAYSHVAVEHDGLIANIQAEIDRGVALSDIAVIVRTNREVEELAALLRRAGIPVTASADSDILSHPITVHVRSLLAAIAEPENEQALFTVLHESYWGIDRSDLVRVCAARSYTTSLSEIISDKQRLLELTVDPAPFQRVLKVLREAEARQLTDSPQRVVAYALETSGFLEAVLTHDKIEGARVVRRLYDEIEALVNNGTVSTVGNVVSAFANYEKHGLGLTAPFIAISENTVIVSTSHKAKGLEYQVVFLPHMTDNVWGSKSIRRYFSVPLTRHEHTEYDALDDERRLLYVALTRAKEKVYLSHAGTDNAGKELVPSRFLDELDQSQVATAVTDDIEQDFSPLQDVHVGQTTNTVIASDALVHILRERGLSATALNNYLNSPWDYLYRNVLRIPEVQPLHMMFGTAVHGVLETVTKAHTATGVTPSASDVKKFLEQELGVLPLAKEEFVRLLEKGLETLTLYIPYLVNNLPKKTEEEKKLRVQFQTGAPEVPEIPLTGMFDRLDFSDSGAVVRVVDYKTGKPKTRNVIEGKTASSDGGYKRQLVFYALLLSLYDDDRYQTKEAVLSFVEPDGKGVIHEESFTITDEEVAELADTIRRVVGEICAGSWLTEPVAEGSTEYYQLAKLWQQGM